MQSELYYLIVVCSVFGVLLIGALFVRKYEVALRVVKGACAFPASFLGIYYFVLVFFPPELGGSRGQPSLNSILFAVAEMFGIISLWTVILFKRSTYENNGFFCRIIFLGLTIGCGVALFFLTSGYFSSESHRVLGKAPLVMFLLPLLVAFPSWVVTGRAAWMGLPKQREVVKGT